MYNLNGLFILTLFDDDRLILFVDYLNCFFHKIIEIELEGLQGKFYLCNLTQSEVDEVSVVCLRYLLAVEVYLVLHHHPEIVLNFLNVSGRQQIFDVSKDNEVIGSGIFQGLVDSLEPTDLWFFEIFEQQSTSYSRVFLVRVVGRTLVSTSLLVDLLHLLV